MIQKFKDCTDNLRKNPKFQLGPIWYLCHQLNVTSLKTLTFHLFPKFTNAFIHFHQKLEARCLLKQISLPIDLEFLEFGQVLKFG